MNKFDRPLPPDTLPAEECEVCCGIICSECKLHKLGDASEVNDTLVKHHHKTFTFQFCECGE